MLLAPAMTNFPMGVYFYSSVCLQRFASPDKGFAKHHFVGTAFLCRDQAGAAAHESVSRLYARKPNKIFSIMRIFYQSFKFCFPKRFVHIRIVDKHFYQRFKRTCF